MKKRLSLIILMILGTWSLQASDLGGTWISETSSTQGIKRLMISPRDHTIRVIRECRRRFCDWGRTRYTPTARGLLAVWPRDRAYQVVLAERVGYGRLKVIQKRLPYYGSGVRTRVLYFRKAGSVYPRQDRLQAFTGRWVPLGYHRNRGLFRLRISMEDSALKVRARGRCYPGICEWGSSRVEYRHGKLVVHWHQRGIERIATFRGIARDRHGRYTRLKVEILTRLRHGREYREVLYLRRER